MATITPNIGLVLENSLTSVARANLLKIDSLGSTFLVDSQQNTVVRSRSNIVFLPNEPSSGGTGIAGDVQFGIDAQPLGTFIVKAATVELGSGVSIADTAAGSSGRLALVYKSDYSGSLDNTERSLTIDTEGGSRALVMSDNLHIQGGEVRLIGPATVTLPESGTLVNRTATETLTNKTLDKLRMTAGSYTSTLQAGNITANQTFILPDSDGTQGQVLAKGAGNTLVWDTPAVGNEDVYTWTPADGTTLTIVHNYNTYNVLVQILDNTNSYANIEVDAVSRPTPNTLQLVSTSIPPNNWTVLIKEIS